MHDSVLSPPMRAHTHVITQLLTWLIGGQLIGELIGGESIGALTTRRCDCQWRHIVPLQRLKLWRGRCRLLLRCTAILLPLLLGVVAPYPEALVAELLPQLQRWRRCPFFHGRGRWESWYRALENQTTDFDGTNPVVQQIGRGTKFPDEKGTSWAGRQSYLAGLSLDLVNAVSAPTTGEPRQSR